MMSKIKIKVTLKTNEEETEEIYQAIKTEQKMCYHDSKYRVTIFFNEPRLIRENDEYIMEMKFKQKEKTIANCYIKQMKQNIKLDMITKQLTIDENLIVIEYDVLSTEQTVLFKLEVLHD